MAVLPLPQRRRVRAGDFSPGAGRPGTAELHALRTGQPAMRVAPQGQTRRQGALDLLVGRGAQPDWRHPPWARRWVPILNRLSFISLSLSLYLFSCPFLSLFAHPSLALSSVFPPHSLCLCVCPSRYLSLYFPIPLSSFLLPLSLSFPFPLLCVFLSLFPHICCKPAPPTPHPPTLTQ